MSGTTAYQEPYHSDDSHSEDYPNRVRLIDGQEGGMLCNKTVNEDLMDLEKFVKFFSLKAVQVIIQSRLGRKMKTDCKPLSSGSDWFNLNVEDNMEILEQTRSAMSQIYGKEKSVSNSRVLPAPLMIEISLQSISDLDAKLTLELWCIYFDFDETEANVKVSHTAYNGMSLLLKSVISVTRVLPAYKLSRRISSCALEGNEDDFRLFYNVYPAEARLEQAGLKRCHPKDFGELYSRELGENNKTTQLGKVMTPYGTVKLDLAYRTKYELDSANSISKSIQSSRPMMIKSDHYGSKNTVADSEQANVHVNYINETLQPYNAVTPDKKNPSPVEDDTKIKSPKAGPSREARANGGFSSGAHFPTAVRRKPIAAFVDPNNQFICLENDTSDEEEAILRSSSNQKIETGQNGRKQSQNFLNFKEGTKEAENCQINGSKDDMHLSNGIIKSVDNNSDEQDKNYSTNKNDDKGRKIDDGFVDIHTPFAPVIPGESPLSLYKFCRQAPLCFGTFGSSADNATCSSSLNEPKETMSREAAAGTESSMSSKTGGDLLTEESLQAFESELVIFDDFVKKLCGPTDLEKSESDWNQ